MTLEVAGGADLYDITISATAKFKWYTTRDPESQNGFISYQEGHTTHYVQPERQKFVGDSQITLFSKELEVSGNLPARSTAYSKKFFAHSFVPYKSKRRLVAEFEIPFPHNWPEFDQARFSLEFVSLVYPSGATLDEPVFTFDVGQWIVGSIIDHATSKMGESWRCGFRAVGKMAQEASKGVLGFTYAFTQSDDSCEYSIQITLNIQLLSIYADLVAKAEIKASEDDFVILG